MRVIYPEIWFAVDYETDECFLKVKAYKITSYVDNTEYDTEDVFNGTLRFDGCINFEYSETHYCGLYHAEQFYKLLQEIYKYAKDNNILL